MYNKQIEANVLYLYLVKEKSHRFIQKNVLNIEAPARGGGFIVMKILHNYGIDGSLKGALKDFDFETLDYNMDNKLDNAIEIIRNNYQLFK